MKMEKGIFRAVLVSCAVVSGACRVVAAPNENASELTHGNALPKGLVPSLIAPLPAPERSTAPYSYHYIKLKNVALDVVAWRLDPAHFAEPETIAQSQLVVEESPGLPGQPPQYSIRRRKVTNNRPFTNLLLPTGVDAIIPMSLQNSLLVYASPVGYSRLETILKDLDVPVRQVELELQFASMSRAAASTFGIHFSSHEIRNLPETTFLGKDYSKRLLDALVKQGKARIIVSQRLRLDSGQSATIMGDARLADVRLEAKSKTGQVVEDTGEVKPSTASSFFLATRYEFTINPTVNKDDTILTHVIPFVRAVLTTTDGTGEVPVGGSSRLDMAEVCTSGGTYAMAGLRVFGSGAEVAGQEKSELSSPSLLSNNPDQQMVVFVTPYLVPIGANQDTEQPQTTEPKPVRP